MCQGNFLTKQSYIRLVHSSSLQEADNALLDGISREDEISKKSSKSHLVNKFASFADDLDKQIELILMS